MTMKERSGFEQMLFMYSNTNPEIRQAVQRVYDNCVQVIEFGKDWSEARFGMRYCELILDNRSQQSPNSKAIARIVGEPLSSYYLYRKQILDKIEREIKKG